METLADVVDFLPKLGFNSYFIQFRQAHVFFSRWYRHTGHPVLQDDAPFPVEQADTYTRLTAEEIGKRGLVCYAVGHGWTCDPFGMPGLSWEKEGPVPEASLRHFAEVNGKRALWGGVALNTDVCLSNPETRRIKSGHYKR